jgi:DNA-directed RNA polymerase subunit RPC12/RpoP
MDIILYSRVDHRTKYHTYIIVCANCGLKLLQKPKLRTKGVLRVRSRHVFNK